MNEQEGATLEETRNGCIGGNFGVQYLVLRYHKKSRFRLADKRLYFLRLSRLWLRRQSIKADGLCSWE